MGWLNSNPLFDMFGQRALLRTYYEGADFGECLTTINRIGTGTADDWYKEWMTTAARLENIGDACLAKNHVTSAREAYLRSTTYYQVAYFPFFGNSADTRLAQAFNKETSVFHKAAALFKKPIEVIEIPYGKITLPGYFIKVDAEDHKPRPTLVHTNGYDSNIQEMFFNHAPAAIRRGYNCLLFDGPGQGRNLIRDGITMRPDWENVVSPVIDYALSRSEIDPKKIILAGWSFGGLLASRAAGFEHRIAALIADPGQWDMQDTIRNLPFFSPQEKIDFPNMNREKIDLIENKIKSNKEADPMSYWRIIQRGFSVNGKSTLYEYLQEMIKYKVSEVVDKISCPALITYSEGDPTAEGAFKLYDAIKVQKKLVQFLLSEGSGGHCEAMARSLYHQRVFDWLDETLGNQS